eukprot:scaffold113626_cov63-Phaeocystis_antarctica.AAC.4
MARAAVHSHRLLGDRIVQLDAPAPREEPWCLDVVEQVPAAREGHEAFRPRPVARLLLRSAARLIAVHDAQLDGQVAGAAPEVSRGLCLSVDELARLDRPE